MWEVNTEVNIEVKTVINSVKRTLNSVKQTLNSVKQGLNSVKHGLITVKTQSNGRVNLPSLKKRV